MKLKLQVDSHDFGSLFRVLKAVRFFLISCKGLLSPTRRRRNNWITDILLFVFMTFNILFFVIGLIALVCGLHILNFAENDSIRIGLFITLAAILILFTSIFGCVGGITSERPYLGVYAVFMAVVIIIEIICVFLCVTFSFHLYASFSETIMMSFLSHYKHPMDHQHSKFINSAVDYFQKKLHCCGVYRPSDWALSNFVYLDQRDGCLPDSCNCTDNKDHCNHFIIPYNTDRYTYRPINQSCWSHGCSQTLVVILESNIINIIEFGILVAAAQVAALVYSACMILERSKNKH